MQEIHIMNRDYFDGIVIYLCYKDDDFEEIKPIELKNYHDIGYKLCTKTPLDSGGWVMDQEVIPCGDSIRSIKDGDWTNNLEHLPSFESKRLRDK